MSFDRRIVPSWLRRFSREEDGVISAHSLFLFLTTCAVGAVGLDVTYFFAARTELQVAADIAAHAAIYRVNVGNHSATEAKDDAQELVYNSINGHELGNVIRDSDIVFGTYDFDNDFFHADPSSDAAVLVMAEREEANGNPVYSFLFRVAGVTQMDVGASAVAIRYYPPCMSEGFVAADRVDIQSENSFFRGFCMHSNDHVEINSGNYFEDGTVVSMPDKANFVMPASGSQQNEGIDKALTNGWYDLYILERVKAPGTGDLREGDVTLNQAITSATAEERPSYIAPAQTPISEWVDLTAAVKAAGGNFTTDMIQPGRVHKIECTSFSTSTSRGSRGDLTGGDGSDILFGGNGNSGGNSGGGGGGVSTLSRIEMPGGLYSNFVLMTDCPIFMSGKTNLQDAVISTTNTSSDSVKTSSGANNGLVLGKDDGCAPGGGAQIITRGGFSTPAKFEVFGGRIIALGDISFTANATGEGVSLISGQRIDGRSKMDMTTCGSQDDSFEAPYFRMAR